MSSSWKFLPMKCWIVSVPKAKIKQKILVTRNLDLKDWFFDASVQIVEDIQGIVGSILFLHIAENCFFVALILTFFCDILIFGFSFTSTFDFRLSFYLWLSLCLFCFFLLGSHFVAFGALFFWTRFRRLFCFRFLLRWIWVFHCYYILYNGGNSSHKVSHRSES